MGAETTSSEDPLGTDTANDNGGTKAVDNNAAKLSTLSAIASVTVDVVLKEKADAVDAENSCDRSRVPSTLRLPPKRKRRGLEGIGIPGDTGVGGLYGRHAKKRRRIPRKSAEEVLILTDSPL